VIESTLRVHHHRERVDIEGREVPLEAEPSATLAYALAESQVWRLERRGFLRGDVVGREIERPLVFLEPYQPGRIPVVFVHGTASSPARWADMLNVLMNDHRLRDRFQFWFFFYGSGSAIPYSAFRLRQALTAAVAALDPQGRDAALQQMVVVGHSQGGLLARLTATASGDRFWRGISTRSIDELEVSDDTRALLRQVFVFEPLPFVRQVVFLATPHRGAVVAEHSLVNLLAGFVRLPQTLTSAATDLVTGNADALRFDPRRPTFGAIYGMRPGNAFLVELDDTRLAPGVAAHSVIAVRGDLPPQGQTDGVVSYESATLDWTESELVIPRAGHSVQRNPLAIEEVRRVLEAHADAVCTAEDVGCAPAR
jgi:pimeloyl-ACP methyl ester carboxylesterase